MRKRDMTRYGVLIIILAIAALFITGCGAKGVSSSTSKKQYTGYDSIELKFADRSPPNEVVLESDCVKYGSCDNEIPIVVELKNKGASDAIVEVFIHGYDKNIISIAGDELYRPKAGYINFNWKEGSGYTFSMGGTGIYLGFRGGGSGTSSQITTGKASFGTGAFRSDGSAVGVTINAVDDKRIGFNAGRVILNSAVEYCGNAANCGFQSVVFLEGDTRETPGGGLEVLDFPAYAWGLPESLEKFRQPLMVTACYSYETRATAMVCIDPRPNNNNNKACRPQTVGLAGGQGAPVAVTSVEQQVGTRKTAFTIRVQHTKKGQYDVVYDLWQMRKCNPYSTEITKATDINVVHVRWIALSGIPLNCMSTPEYGYMGKIRLNTGGSGEIVCTTTDAHYSSDAAYEAPLEIQLDYGYSKSIYQVINIRQI